MKSLKLNLLLPLFFFGFLIESYAMIEPIAIVQDTTKNIPVDDDSICAEKVKKSAKSALGVSGIFLIPTTLLGSTFLISKSVFKSALMLSLVKGAALASLLVTLGGFVAFLAFKRKLKRKNWGSRKTPILDNFLSATVLAIGIISVASVFFFSIPTLAGLGFLLKVLNVISGGILIALGLNLLIHHSEK